MLYAARMVGDIEQARDIVQETFLRLCAQPRAEVEQHLAQWLFTVCRNRAMDIMRKERRMSPLTDEQMRARPSAAPSPQEMLERQECSLKVQQLLETLPPNQREVIRLKFQNGFSYKEISGVTGLSVSNVGVLLHLGINAIRAQMLGHLPSDATA